jgi:hypothetical protein
VQAFQGYFERGRFIPFGAVSVPEHKRAIVTILDEAAPDDVRQRLEELDELVAMVHASIDEEMPLFERARFSREVEL